MSTRHQMKSRYPAPAATVLRMMSDRNFHVRKMEKIGLSKYEILDHRFDGRNFSIRMERRVPVQMPGGKRTAAETTVINEEQWDLAAMTGRVKAEPKGMPLDMSCQVSMADEAEGCVLTYDWTIHARIPVVGGQLERFIIGDLESRAAAETSAAIELLADYR